MFNSGEYYVPQQNFARSGSKKAILPESFLNYMWGTEAGKTSGWEGEADGT